MMPISQIMQKMIPFSDGKHQESKGVFPVRDFLRDTDLSKAQIDRAAFLVGLHYIYTAVEGKDYQILLEAEHIANVIENGYSKENIRRFMEKIMRIDSGKALTRQIFRV